MAETVITQDGDYTGVAFDVVTVDRARVSFTDCTFASLSVLNNSIVTLSGVNRISGWPVRDGLAVLNGGHVNLMGKLDIAGSGSGWGIHCGYHSRMVCFWPNCNLTISNVDIGCQLGLSGMFQHHGAGSTITIKNPSRASETYAVQATDHSSWSTDQHLVVDSFQYAFDLNSISYAEAIGGKQITNCQANTRVSQNSWAWLP